MAPVVLACAALDAAFDQHDDCCGGRRRTVATPDLFGLNTYIPLRINTVTATGSSAGVTAA
jgi:hypothetical protein